MKIKDFYLLIFLLTNIVFANGINSIKIGANFSSFRNEGTEWKPGFVLSVAKEWNLYKSFDGGIVLQYLDVNGIFRDKTIAPVWGLHEVNEVIHQDIICSLHYLDISLLGKYHLNRSDNINMYLISNFGISINVYDNSKYNYLYTEHILPNAQKQPHDYYSYDYKTNEYGYSALIENSGLHLSFGFGCKFSIFFMETYYKYYFQEVDVAQDALIDENLHSFHVLFSVFFNNKN